MILQIDFRTAVDRVNHRGILHKVYYVGIGGSVLAIQTQFPSKPSQLVMAHGCRSKLVNVVSAGQHESASGPLLFLLYTSELFSILENKVIGYADGATLYCISCAIPRSLIRDLGRVSEWCDLFVMKLNESKTKTTIVSRSHTVHPQSHHLLLVEPCWRNMMPLIY